MTMTRILRFAAVILLLGQRSLAQDASAITGKLLLKEDQVICSLQNVSDQDILIRDLNIRIAQAFGEIGNQFNRGKEWVYLRKLGSGFGSEGYMTAVRVDVRKWKRNIMVENREEIVLPLRVATFDSLENTISRWQRVEIVVPLVEHDGEDREAFSRTTQAEQGGAGQPATRPQSDTEGGDKAQPESEGRSR